MTPLADRFQESFDDYCQRNGIVGDLVPFAKAIAEFFYIHGYQNGCNDQHQVKVKVQ